MFASGAAYNKASGACIGRNDRIRRARSGDEIRIPAATCLLFAARSRGRFIGGDSMPDLIQADSPGPLPRFVPEGLPDLSDDECVARRARAIAAHDSEHLDEVARLIRRLVANSSPDRSVAPEVRKEPETAGVSRHVAFCRSLYQRWTDFRFLPRHIRFASDRSANVRFSDRAPENGRWPSAHQRRH
jgi:hypothetical protein